MGSNITWDSTFFVSVSRMSVKSPVTKDFTYIHETDHIPNTGVVFRWPIFSMVIYCSC